MIDRFLVVIPYKALVALGNHLGHGKVTDYNQRGLLSVVVLGSLFVTFRCYGAFKEHTEHFAKAVYRDFYVYEKDDKGKMRLIMVADPMKIRMKMMIS